METHETKTERHQQNEKPFNSGRIFGGGILLIVGGLLLADRVGADLPHWLFTWPMIPVVVGLFVGANQSFKDWGFLIPITVGVIFLIVQNVEGYTLHTLWPVIIIVVGLSMILNSGRRKRCS
jgi:hypothetical protein